MNSVKLELKKERLNDKSFYRYRYETCKIWFDQDLNTGNVFFVGISDEQYPDVDYYVDDTEDRCYPSKVRLDFPRLFIESDSDFESASKNYKIAI